MRSASLLVALGLLAGFLVAIPSVSAEPPDCNDAIDNDNDGFTDYPEDPDCSSPEDDSEAYGSRPFPAHITIRYDRPEGHFIGELSSELPRGCRSDRLVRLKRVRPGRDPVIGRDRTDAGYVWIVEKQDAHGRFYAVAPRRERTRRDGTTVECERVRSVTIIVR